MKIYIMVPNCFSTFNIFTKSQGFVYNNRSMLCWDTLRVRDVAEEINKNENS